MLWMAYVLGEDEHGVWLYTPKGSLVRGKRADMHAESFVGVPTEPGLDVIHLAPAHKQWWFGSWAVDDIGQRTRIDVCTPAEIDGSQVTYVDLELDLYRRADVVGIFDEDELDEAFEAGLISGSEREQSLRTAHDLDGHLRSGHDLFDEVVWRRLEGAVERRLPPLTAIPEP